MRARWPIGLAVLALLVVPKAAFADLTPIEEASEVMIESQGLQSVAIGLLVGADSASTLHFTSTVSEGAFRYDLDPGSMYLGQTATWTTIGTRDGGTGIWRWTTVGTIASLNLGSTGTGGPFLGVDPPYQYELPQLDLLFSDVTYDKKNGKVTSKGTITVQTQDGKVTNRATHTDELITEGPLKGKWKWDTGVISEQKQGDKKFRIDALGLSFLPTGGPGSFETTIQSVPEPSSLALAGIGATAVFWTVRRRRRFI